ncbi:hypothetical protein ACZ87_02258, partial [Candidatus Erwinia dacicola]
MLEWLTSSSKTSILKQHDYLSFNVMRGRCCKVSQGCSHLRFWHER